MRIIKHFIFIIIVSIISTHNLIANAAADNNNKKASEFVDTNAKRVIGVLSNTDKNTKKLELIALFLEVTDYEWMAKFVLGRYWSTLSAAEQKEYTDAYKNYLVSIYVPKYEEYNKQTYNIYASTSLGNEQYQVSMNISSPSSKEAVQIEYRLKDYGSTFKIRDIVAEGVSLLATQRADFSTFLSNNNIKDLIDNLKSKSK
ncbi:toluene tolerance transporter [endosymbiont of Acanthamoeba sp. UWC8]|uniref:MlaC/ttg2D family ABC transporter substrate-binding protein n=1 Tax=endosymbiont of Acanthamoeba sp. UWC8 TaxID=86106 RepID=UPI0004D19719|nr:ABC transporter substrate-binding protein [endosymbiont of Acanthamoeba sp. UWC8]AIF81772.1 toluene tolerance transporter [endosymbiont of Acanthamoeba sp. UWC8]